MTQNKERKFKKITQQVMDLANELESMSDARLKKQTLYFKQLLTEGRKIETILPEAYAVVIEANRRILGMKPYYVQIYGAIALFYGNVAEMKTGEGKTLTATMPMYLRGLEGKGAFLITSNSYLAWRDAEEVGKVFKWLGLSIEVGAPRYDEDIDKAKVYESDIVYTTPSALGFDYLFDNLAESPFEQFVTRFHYVLIDEVDAILLDMAQTPLVISGAPKVQSNLYHIADWFCKSLIENTDYMKSDNLKNIWFTEKGIKKAEEYFGVEGILSEDYTKLYRSLVVSLKANYTLERDHDYVVENDEILLLDDASGRKLPGTKLQGGLHQALEAKEGMSISKESKSMGTITYQNLFRKFKVISGMTGTGKTDEEEFRETYNMDVILIPTHLPVNRKDYHDQVFVTIKEKVNASLQTVKKAFNQQRPVLIETGSVSMSELYSLILLKDKIPHNVLNATSASKESWIVSEAGKKGAITVATSMAGRGTDIKLDQASLDKGGLLVVGTERMTSERIDNQLRGRAGRQGEPGESIFYVSMEDKIVIENSPKWVARTRLKLLDDIQERDSNNPKPLEGRKFEDLINKAQTFRKNEEYMSRKNVLEFDMVTSAQREAVYNARNKVMESTKDTLDNLIDFCVNKTIRNFVANKKNLTKTHLADFIFTNLDHNFDRKRLNEIKQFKQRNIRVFLEDLIAELLVNFNLRMPDAFQQLYFKRILILKAIDVNWIEQSYFLQQLKAIVSSRNWAQHRPIFEYQSESQKAFKDMKKAIWQDVVKNLLLSELLYEEDGSIDIDFP